MRLQIVARVAAMVAIIALTTGSNPGRDVRWFDAENYPDRLSEWSVVYVDDGQLVLGDRVVQYDLSMALFSDYASKLRTIWLPEGENVRIEDGDMVFPVGTVVSKTFFYFKTGDAAISNRAWDGQLDALRLDQIELLETRLLVRQPEGWEPIPYRWRGDDAKLHILGDVIPLTIGIGGSEPKTFPYIVPTRNECAGCHAVNHTSRELVPIGLKQRHLNFRRPHEDENQLVNWQSSGVLNGKVDLDDQPSAIGWDSPDLDARARAYLDINCGHCHSAQGAADTSALWLDAGDHPAEHLGICKPPIAAGRGSGPHVYGIVPGRPEASIMHFRLASTETDIRMPELGRSLVDEKGLSLIADWIRAMPGNCGG